MHRTSDRRLEKWKIPRTHDTTNKRAKGVLNHFIEQSNQSNQIDYAYIITDITSFTCTNRTRARFLEHGRGWRVARRLVRGFAAPSKLARYLAHGLKAEPFPFFHEFHVPPNFPPPESEEKKNGEKKKIVSKRAASLGSVAPEAIFFFKFSSTELQVLRGYTRGSRYCLRRKVPRWESGRGVIASVCGSFALNPFIHSFIWKRWLTDYLNQKFTQGRYSFKNNRACHRLQMRMNVKKVRVGARQNFKRIEGSTTYENMYSSIGINLIPVTISQ